MAINPETKYPGKIAPSTPQYPYGQARNITVPGDGTGTPWEAALVNDLFGFQQALLSAAGVVPSGTPEAADASQYLQSILNICARSVPATTDLISSSGLKYVSGSEGSVVISRGYAGEGDGGGGVWRKTSLTGQTPSQSPLQLADGLFNDGDGNQWELISNGATPGMVGADSAAADNTQALQAWINHLIRTGDMGSAAAVEYKYLSTLNISGTVSFNLPSASVFKYMGSTDGIVITGERHKISFGTVTVDIAINPATRKVIKYLDLSRSKISFSRLGSNSGAAIYWDGPNSTLNSGDNTWEVQNGETGGSDYGIQLEDSPTRALEGETFRVHSMYGITQAVIKCGTAAGPNTIKFNKFYVALFGSQAGAPLCTNLAVFYGSFNTLYMDAWTESVDEEFVFDAITTDNYIIATPGLQRGGRKDIRILDEGRNYYLPYKNISDIQGDDTVRSFRPQRDYGVIEIYAEQRAYCLLAFNMAGPQIEIISNNPNGGTTFEAFTTPLTGTTGTDGNINVGIDPTSGLIYIENRSNLTRNIVYNTRLFG